MKRKINLVILYLFFISTICIYAKPPADIKDQPDYYYKQGCNALKKRNLELAKENFFNGVQANMTVARHPSGYELDYSIKKHIKNVEEDNTNGIEWKVYYYKGLLESNLIFNFGFSNTILKGNISKPNETEAIKSFEKSISIYDNYQSHIALSILKDKTYEEEELNKAIDLAVSKSSLFQYYPHAPWEIEAYIAKKYEDIDEYDKAIAHYEKGFSYSKQSFGERGLGNFPGEIKRVNHKKETLQLIKSLGFSSYIEYENYEKEINSIIFERTFIKIYNIRENIDKLEKALECFSVSDKEFAAKIDFILGYYYEKNEDFETALKYYNNAEENAPNCILDPWPNLYYGGGYYLIEYSIPRVKQKIIVFPNLKANGFSSYGEYETYTSLLLEKCKKPEIFKTEIEAGMELAEKLKDYIFLHESAGIIGYAFFEQENYDNAIIYLKKALNYELNNHVPKGDSPGLLESHIAFLYEKKDDLQEALIWLEKIFKEYGEPHMAKEIERIKEKIENKKNTIIVAITSPYSPVITYPKSANYKKSKSNLAPYTPRKGFHMMHDETVWFNPDLDWKVSSQTLFQGSTIREVWYSVEFKTTVTIDYFPNGGFMTPGKMSAMVVVECDFE